MVGTPPSPIPNDSRCILVSVFQQRYSFQFTHLIIISHSSIHFWFNNIFSREAFLFSFKFFRVIIGAIHAHFWHKFISFSNCFTLKREQSDFVKWKFSVQLKFIFNWSSRTIRIRICWRCAQRCIDLAEYDSQFQHGSVGACGISPLFIWSESMRIFMIDRIYGFSIWQSSSPLLQGTGRT